MQFIRWDPSAEKDALCPKHVRQSTDDYNAVRRLPHVRHVGDKRDTTVSRAFSTGSPATRTTRT